MSFASVAAAGQWPCLHLGAFPAWGKKKGEPLRGVETAGPLEAPLHLAEEGEGGSSCPAHTGLDRACLKHYQRPRQEPSSPTVRPTLCPLPWATPFTCSAASGVRPAGSPHRPGNADQG